MLLLSIAGPPAIIANICNQHLSKILLLRQHRNPPCAGAAARSCRVHADDCPWPSYASNPHIALLELYILCWRLAEWCCNGSVCTHAEPLEPASAGCRGSTSVTLQEDMAQMQAGLLHGESCIHQLPGSSIILFCLCEHLLDVRQEVSIACSCSQWLAHANND